MIRSLFVLVSGAAFFAAPVALCSAQNGAPGVQTSSAARDTTPFSGLAVDGIAAKVGEKVILISEVDAERLTMRASGREPRSEAEWAQMRKEALEQLIDSELLVQKAAAEKIEVNEVDVQRRFEAREKQVRSQFPSDAEFRTALKENGYGNLEDWRKSQIDAMRRATLQQDVVQKLRRDGKLTAVNVSEREVKEAFERNQAALGNKPALVSIRQIIIPTKPSEESKKRARAKMDSIRAELVAHPNDFESIAKKESMDRGSGELGGDLGWNRPGRMVPEFDRVMFSLNPGVLSPVVETSFGYHVIRVDRVQGAEVKARHILIMPALDSADDARAAATAKEVATAWRDGANLDSLTIRYHDDAAGEDKSIRDYIRDSLPEPYRVAIEGKKTGDIVDPFAIPSGQPGINKYVVAQLTAVNEAGEWTLDERRDIIRASLSDENSYRRLIDSLKKSTYVSVTLDPLKEAAK